MWPTEVSRRRLLACLFIRFKTGTFGHVVLQQSLLQAWAQKRVQMSAYRIKTQQNRYVFSQRNQLQSVASVRNIVIGYVMAEIISTQRNNKTYRKRKYSEEKVIKTANEIYVSNIRSLQWLLLSLKEVVRYEMLTMT